MPTDYPLCREYGIPVLRHECGVRYCPRDDVRRIFEECGLTDRWRRWGAGGITAIAEGFYPWDIEKFLRGGANFD